MRVVLGPCTASRLHASGYGGTAHCGMLAHTPELCTPVAAATPLDLNALQLPRDRPADLEAPDTHTLGNAQQTVCASAVSTRLPLPIFIRVPVLVMPFGLKG